jgi:Tfp pilus assembly protein PilF
MIIKKHQISGFPILVLLVLTLQVACTGSPKKVIYTPDEFRSEVNRLVGDDHPPLRIRYDELFVAGIDSYTQEVDLLRPPFQMDAGSRERLLHCVGFSGSETVRLMQLRDCVINRPSRISYNGTLTLDATGCLELREGNCFALTNLFVGAARDAGLNSYYVMVEDVITNQAAGQQVFHINHIVSGVIVNSGHRMVDFIPDPREYHVRTTLSDIEAAGLYYNNLGANLMVSGDLDGAEYLLNVAAKLYPDSYQVQNNLGLLHRRRGEVKEAQLAFEKAFSLARFPDLVMGNLLNLYRETGQADRVEDLQRQLGRVSRRNPYLYIAMARESYQREEYQEALDYLASARRINRDIPAIYVLESDIWEILENPRRQKRAQKRLARLLELDGAAGADDAARGVTPTASG